MYKKIISLAIIIMFIGVSLSIVPPSKNEILSLATGADDPLNGPAGSNSPVRNTDNYNGDDSGGSWSDSFQNDSGIVYGMDGQLHADRGTLGLWHFNEGTGNRIFDASVNGNQGTLMNMFNDDWVSGRYDKGIEFDGVNDYIEVPNSKVLNPINEISVELWLKPYDLSSPEQVILEKPTLTKDPPHYQYNMFIDGNGSVHFGLTLDGTYASTGPVDVGLELGRFINLAATYDGQYIKLYANGALKSVKNATGKIKTDTTVLRIGSHVFFPGGFLKGVLDEIRITEFARTHDEIRNNYQKGVVIVDEEVRLIDLQPFPASGCVGYWGFDDGSGNVAKDGSGYGNDGNLTNMDNADWVNGKIGKGLVFDGTDDYVDCGDNDLFTQNNFTVLAWCKWSEVKEVMIISKDDEYHLEYRNLHGASNFHMTVNLSGSWKGGFKEYMWRPQINQWYHLAGTRNETSITYYINGQRKAAEEGTGILNNTANPLNIGRRSQNDYYFKGVIDEASIYDRALSEKEIASHYQYTSTPMYYHNGTIRSEIIELPDEMAWNTFYANRSVPLLTYLNLSVYDAENDELLVQDTGSSDKLYLDMAEIDSSVHTSVYFEAYFQTDWAENTPTLFDWSINWTPISSPRLGKEIEDIEIMEDSPASGLVNLSHHFTDAYTQFEAPVFALVHHSDNPNITVRLNETRLDVTYLAENWTGSVELTANCTNMYGYSTLSNRFNITVINENDKPVWSGVPPGIAFEEDHNYTSEFTLADFTFDVENDLLGYSMKYSDAGLNVSITADKRVFIVPNDDYSGETWITLRVYEVLNDSMAADINISISVNSVNDAPSVELHKPYNNSVNNDTNVTFSWNYLDVDDELENITFDFYLGMNDLPSLHTSDVPDLNITVRGLEKGAIYYWYVIPNDGKADGICLNESWRFEIFLEILVPEIILRDPSNNTIIHGTETNLIWTAQNLSGRTALYHVYLGDSYDNLSEIISVSEGFYRLSDLTQNTTYYWKITAEIEGVEGEIQSEIRSFFCSPGFVEIHSLTVQFDKEEIVLKPGETLKVKLYIKNLGNTRENITLEIIGEMAEYVKIEQNTTIAAAKEKTIKIEIFADPLLEAGDYSVVINAIYSGKEASARLNVTILASEETDSTKSETTYGWFWILLALLVIFSIITLVVVIGRRSQKKMGAGEEKEAPEDIKPSIETGLQGQVQTIETYDTGIHSEMPVQSSPNDIIPPIQPPDPNHPGFPGGTETQLDPPQQEAEEYNANIGIEAQAFSGGVSGTEIPPAPINEVTLKIPELPPISMSEQPSINPDTSDRKLLPPPPP